MANEKDDFISLFLDYTKAYESPESFWRWSAYATVGAVLRSNVYFEHKLGKIYPNMYILFLADSAIYRKGGSFPPVTDLLAEVNNTKLIEGRMSVQFLIDKLSQDMGSKKAGAAIKGGAGIVINDELSSAFVDDRALIPLLTTMYDYKPIFTYGLRSTQDVKIKELCLSMLSATNEALMREIFTERANYGGLLRRVFLVRPNERRPPASFFNLEKPDEATRKLLIEKLRAVQNLSGKVTATEGAKGIYNAWYEQLYKSYDSNKDRTGVLGGIHTMVLKLAIVIAANKLSSHIDEEHMIEAISQVVLLKPNYDAYVMSTGRSDDSKNAGLLLTALIRADNYSLSRKTILMKYFTEMSSEDLDRIILTLEQGGIVKSNIHGSELLYQLTPGGLKYFEVNVKTKTKEVVN